MRWQRAVRAGNRRRVHTRWRRRPGRDVDGADARRRLDAAADRRTDQRARQPREADRGAATGSLRLKTTLVPRGPAAAVVLDEQQVAMIGEGAKRLPVVATVNGYAWQTSVTRLPDALADALADDA